MPAEGHDYAYLSSGTWSLIGVETPQPVVNETALALNFTNEGGVCDIIRLLKNITGLWLIQECRRNWQQAGQRLSWDEIVRLAAAAPAFTAFVDVGAPDCAARRHARPYSPYCERTGQPVPQDNGTVARRVREPRAEVPQRHRNAGDTDRQARRCAPHRRRRHQNRLLNQFAADAAGRPVVAGPIEATAIGNLLMQMLAVGDIGSLAEGREVVRRSFPTETFEAQETAAWAGAYGRFVTLVGK